MVTEYDMIPINSVRMIVTGLLLPLVLFVPMDLYCTGLLVILLIFLTTQNRPYWIYVITKTFKRDMRLIYVMAVSVLTLLWYEKRDQTVPKLFNRLVEKHPNRVAYETEEGPWTYEKLSKFSNKAARMFKNYGVKRGDCVGVIMNNGGARYPGFWLGLSYLGAPVALIPPQLRGTALIHSIKAAKTTTLLYSYHLVEAIKEIQNDPDIKKIKLLQYNMDSDTQPLTSALIIDSVMESQSSTALTEEVNLGKYMDTFMYIYTSGTTGLPKAAVIKHMRYLMVAVLFKTVGNISSKDVVYTPLPLHHTAGGMLGAGQALVCGATVVIRNKFSASNFWKDCIKYNCTIAQYIGEICRFLLVAADASGESDPAGPHKLRLMIGNGLKEPIWKKFQTTFKIPSIFELYGATEGNTNMINITSQIGSVGFVPRFAAAISPIILVKCDGVTGEIIRDKNGLCIPCKVLEPGLLMGKLNHKKTLYTFSGYADKDATNKKIIRNVLAHDDCYFNSGDILIMDHLGYFYFKDRTGDTFRWRGENVSTTEVENIISKAIGLADISVYGVEIPNVEGRAGMMAIVDVQKKFDPKSLVSSLKKSLPPYAIPIFIRVLTEMPVTTTFKMIKKDLQVEGFDVNKITDDMYFLNQSSYVRLTVELYEDIVNGRIRL